MATEVAVRKIHVEYQREFLCGLVRDTRYNLEPEHLWAPLRNSSGATCKECAKKARKMLTDGGPLYPIGAEGEEMEREQGELIRLIARILQGLAVGEGRNGQIFLGAICQIIIWHIVGESNVTGDCPIGTSSGPERHRALTTFSEEVGLRVMFFAGLKNEMERRLILRAILQETVTMIGLPLDPNSAKKAA